MIDPCVAIKSNVHLLGSIRRIASEPDCQPVDTVHCPVTFGSQCQSRLGFADSVVVNKRHRLITAVNDSLFVKWRI